MLKVSLVGVTIRWVPLIGWGGVPRPEEARATQTGGVLCVPDAKSSVTG